MARFGSKVWTFLSNSGVRSHYVRYILARATGRDAVVRSGDGSSFVAPPTFNEYWSIARQHPSELEMKLFRELVPDGAVVLDVGANMGLYTVMASRGRAISRIIAFEPIHRYCEVWHRNIERNQVPNATLVQCAVDEKGGVANFTLDLSAPLNNRFAIGDSTASRLVQTKVSAVALDDVCDALDIKQVDLLKIDVEGAEPRVLRGARRLLAERRVIAMYVEFIVEFMESLGEDPGVVYDEVTGFGYDFFAITPSGGVGEQLDRFAAVEGRRAPPGAPERDFWGLNVVIRRRD